MTASAEARAPGSRPPDGIGPEFRREAARAQSAALPAGRVVVSCTAPLGAGGLGRHLQEILDALSRRGSPGVCICASTRASAPSAGRPRHPFGIPYLTSVFGALPALPSSAGVRVRAAMVEFDAYAAGRLPAGADALIAFNSQALSQLRAARRAGYGSVALVSANPHLRRLARQHALARRQYPLEGSWASRLLERNLAEYAEADRIYVASSYTRESFVEQGFGDEQLLDFPLTPDPRYSAEAPRAQSDRFEIVYVGSLSVHKGVPLLIDAVRRLPHADLRLRLVGGWGTPGMRRFVEEACAADRRITVSPGDPLPHLRAAGVCVHAAYEDGFGYAPAEAVAAAVPVIVSEDTGMKDLIDRGRNGVVLPTGDLDALSEAIDACYRGELLAARPAPSADE
jgi:glycosyltransferase involved in cell wall biosynthesis